jgi:tetratricopeptide (TPR) repeat protein
MKKPTKRLALVVLGPVVFLGLLEGFLFLTGRFEPVRVLQRAVHEGRAYWATNPDYGPFALRRPDSPMPHHVWLPEEKDPSKLRVVMLGESAVAGFPSEEYSLGRLTRVLWNESYPERPMEVATMAMVGANSHILRDFAIEALQMQPDVLVIYSGNNEVIGPYGPVSNFTGALSARWMVRASMFVRNTRIGRAMESAMHSLGRVLSGEKSWQGLDEHSQAFLATDDPALDAMLAQTRENYRDIIDAARRHNCKVLVCIPAVNLNDWPPLASAVNDTVSAQREYEWAQTLEREGKMAAAWPHYRRACDLDLLRFRADSRVRQVQRELVADVSSPEVGMVDADLWLHECNPTFRSDREFFLEHVHLTFEGRIAVAALITDGIAELTGEVPSAGIGREGYAGIAAWWENFPSRVQAAKDRVLFTEFDDAYLWDATRRLLGMKVFSGMADIATRRGEIGAKADDLRARGQSAWTTERIESARAAAAAKEPLDGWVDLKAAELLANLGTFQQARPHIAAARDKFPRLAQAHMAFAQEALRDGQPRVALGHLADMAELLPAGAKPAAIYAEAHLKAGESEKAIPYLRKMAMVNPQDAGAWLQLANAQAETGQANQAIVTCRRGLERAGQNPALMARLARLLAEKDTATSAELGESLDLARAAVQLDPGNHAHGEVLAFALMVNGYDDEAKSEAGRIIAQAYAEGDYDIITSINQTLNRARKKEIR